MCGIAGLVDFGHRLDAELLAAVARMHTCIAHRGHDGAGRAALRGGDVIETDLAGNERRSSRAAGLPAVYLAHQRLAIIDLSPGGRQPMATADRRHWITYNGEIYNYRDLRSELTGRGQALRTASDTEAIVELLRRDGPPALERMRGMFAFAWWDETERRLVLARDRFGIKPLVFARPAPDLLLFASEPRALLASGLVDDRRNAGRAAEFLERGSLDVAATAWTAIESVAPGSWVAFDGRELRATEYWSLERVLLADRPEVPARDAARVIRPALLESVEAHFVSDVPVGIFLSGGLDSTAIVAAAREVTEGRLQTFTVTMPGLDLDESAAARRAAAAFGADHTELAIDQLDLESALDEFFAAMQRPSVDGLNTFLVARAAARAGVRVALSGVGGDELLGGYPSFVEVPTLRRALRLAGPALRLAAAWLDRWPGTRVTKLAAIARRRPSTLAEVWWEYRRLFDPETALRLAGASGGRAPVLPSGAAFDLLRFCEFRFFLQNQLLGDADAYTMPHPLELRTPLVDHRFVEAVARAGRWARQPGRTFKTTLVAEMEGLSVPAALTARKRGFMLPFDAWLRSALTAERHQAGDLGRRLGQPRYSRFVHQFLSGHLHWSRLWALYVLDRFPFAAQQNGVTRDASSYTESHLT